MATTLRAPFFGNYGGVMAVRLANKASKKNRIAGKKGEYSGMPSPDEMREGMKGLEGHMAERRAKALKARLKKR